jgi:hypothetical protein
MIGLTGTVTAGSGDHVAGHISVHRTATEAVQRIGVSAQSGPLGENSSGTVHVVSDTTSFEFGGEGFIIDTHARVTCLQVWGDTFVTLSAELATPTLIRFTGGRELLARSVELMISSAGHRDRLRPADTGHPDRRSLVWLQCRSLIGGPRA